MDKSNKQAENKPCTIHGVMVGVYHWMITNLPYWVMYKNVRIDSQYKIWLPRWGWSKRQIANAEKRAKELAENIKWD